MTFLAHVVAIMMTFSALATDVTGTWDCTLNWGNGNQRTAVFMLTQKGAEVTGTYKGGLGEFSVRGKVEGSKMILDLEGNRLHLNALLSEDGRKMTGDATVPEGLGTFTGIRRSGSSTK